MIWLMENNLGKQLERLSDYIARILNERRLTSYDVQTRSGNEIGQSYVVKLKNGDITNPSAQKLKALAKGLGVSEDELFAIARGKSETPADFEQKLLYAASGADNWTDEQKEQFILTVRRLAAGIRAEAE